MLDKIKQTTEFLKSKVNLQPEIAIVLGSGLGNLGNEINPTMVIPYKEIPNFPVSTVMGHSSNLIFGTLEGKNVVAMQGRFHYYEGHTMQEVAFPIRIMKALGVKYLFLSNAAGGMNPDFNVGDIMIINDHINFMGTNPLLGPNIDELGPRFPDMSEAYNKKLIDLAIKCADKLNIPVKQGVYIGVTGPTFETPAEYRFFRIIGADAVGMSTVPEVIAAVHSDLPVFGVSIITDLGGFDNIQPISHEEVLKAADAAEPKLSAIIKAMLREL